MSAPEARVFSPEWHEQFNQGNWVALGREPHDESWGDFHPRIVRVLYEEIKKIGAGYSLHRKYLSGHVDLDMADEFRDSHSMVNSISWTPKEETWSGEEETVVSSQERVPELRALVPGG